MQFNRDGLDIPDELVRRQRQGNVVFLCGAGVSVGSRMPHFKSLAQSVVKELRESEELKSKIENGGIRFDELFSQLEENYSRIRVNQIIAGLLKNHTNVKNHKIIADISSSNGVPQIVTTNFDLLFEKAIQGAVVHEPPALPQIHWGDSISGITYLHGRICSRNYVLSQSDFGEAYITQGWAAFFLKELIQKYTVVFCGYAAEDPIIQYFFKGLLKDKDLKEDKSYLDLYAFDSFKDEGDKEKIRKRWKKIRAKPILYPLQNDKHSHLWDTLRAWAQFNPNDVKKKYLSSPKELESYERTQVCYMVKGVAEAKDFADLNPSPHADWIDVFAEEGMLQWFKSDGNPLKDYPYFFGSTPNMPPRLFHLCRWMAKHVTSPIVVGWLVKNRHYPLHPRLLNFLSDNVEEAQKAKDMPESFEKVWDFLFAFFEQRNEQPFFHLRSTDFLPPSGEQINWDDYLESIRAELINLEKYTKEQFVNYFDKIKGKSFYWLDCLNEKKPEPTFVLTGGSIGENTDYQTLMNIPLAEVIKQAGKTSQKIVWGGDDLRPFVGLVRDEPLRAIAALKLATRKKNDDYIPFWRDAISRWNYDKTPPRITRLFHEHLRRLPANVIHHLMQFTLGGWVRDRLLQIAQQDEQYALAIFDDLLKRFLTAPPKQAGSSLLNDDGDTNNPPRTLLEHAINSHFGHITEGLLKIFSAKERKEKSGIPSEFARRFEQLLQAPGDGSYHVACILAQNSLYLHYIDPDWTSQHLFPLFQLTNERSESAWNGLLHSNGLSHPDMFPHLKSDFLNFFEKMDKEWKWENRREQAYESACHWVSVLCFDYEKEGVFSYQDAESCIKKMSPLGASHVLRQLRHDMKHDMKKNGCYRLTLDFIKEAWPQRLDYQSKETMEAFIDILEEAGLAESNEHFPQLLEAVKGFLGEMKNPWLYSFYEGGMVTPSPRSFLMRLWNCLILSWGAIRIMFRGVCPIYSKLLLKVIHLLRMTAATNAFAIWWQGFEAEARREHPCFTRNIFMVSLLDVQHNL